MERIFERGACVAAGRHDLFFSERPDEQARAQQICAGCIVKVECLRFALENEVDWGVWGGLIFWEAQPYYRRRSRGRPRRGEERLPQVAPVQELWDAVRSA
jgi:hypothetical protein